MYQGVAQVLRHYRSGKLPKAFKLMPSLTNWEQILYFTGETLNDMCAWKILIFEFLQNPKNGARQQCTKQHASSRRI